MPIILTAGADDAGRRLDRILRKALPQLPLSAIHRLLRKGFVQVGGGKTSPGRLILEGETIVVNITAETREEKPPPDGKVVAAKTEVSRRLLYEGAGILALNKPSGLAAHGKDSLETQVLSWLKPRLPPSLSFKPGPLHRLDKPSSGLIVFSANTEGARTFSVLMRERRIRKFYLALVEGSVEKAEYWEDELRRDTGLKKTFSVPPPKPGALPRDNAGTETRKALTRVTPLASNGAYTLLLAEIETGRTHQIRAQSAARGHPLGGDKKYGGRFLPGDKPGAGFFLHSWRMEFPESSPFPRFLEAPLPSPFDERIRALFGEEDFTKRAAALLN